MTVAGTKLRPTDNQDPAPDAPPEPDTWRSRIPLSLIVVLAMGLLLRVVVMVAYQPSVLQWIDGLRFARIDPTGLFDDFWMPAGYAAFLTAMHALSSNLVVTIAAQHLVGLLTGILAYLSVRRLGGPGWLGAIAAAFLLLSGDQVYVEHILMTEFLLTFVTLLGLYALVIGAASRNGPKLLLAGVLVAFSGLVRSPALILLPSVAVWLLLTQRGSLARRLERSAWFAGGGAATVLLYALVATTAGHYSGLNDMGGWTLYSRVASFADCDRFTPPAGTEALCQVGTPPERRPGPEYYAYDATSVSRRTFEVTPSGSAALTRFARQVIVHQPLDYLKAVGVDMARYVLPELDSRPWSGELDSQVSFAFQQPELEREVSRELAAKYTATELHSGPGAEGLRQYGEVVRVHRWLLLALLVVAGAGILLGHGRLRVGTGLFALASLALFAAPVLTFTWDYRYGIPPTAVSVVAATMGLGALIERVSQGRSLSEPHPVARWLMATVGNR